MTWSELHTDMHHLDMVTLTCCFECRGETVKKGCLPFLGKRSHNPSLEITTDEYRSSSRHDSMK